MEPHEEISPEAALHDLREHQVELETRTEEMCRLLEEVDTSLMRYFALYDLAPGGYLTLEDAGAILETNLTAANMLAVERSSLLGRPFLSFILKEDHSIFSELCEQLVEVSKPLSCDLRIVRGDAARLWAHLVATKQGEGSDCMLKIVLSDITEHKAAEVRIERLTQLYAALRQSNQAIVHSAGEDDLLPTICRGLVEFGGMKMTWIGMVDEATGMVRPVAVAGTGMEYTEGIQISVKPEEPFGKGPTGTAIRENQPIWCEDFKNDPHTAHWHERAAQYGWSASASLPLRREGKPVGALTIYSPDAGVFDEEARSLLVQMARDISFALDSFAQREDLREPFSSVVLKS